jgi:hypothetical protein
MTLVVGFDTEHEADESLAGRILRTLCDAYPGHGWFVVIRSGIIQVKDMDIHPNWGMALHYSKVNNDAAAMKKAVIRAAGEFLERANLARGAKADDKPTHVDGIPDKHLVRNGL